MKYNQIAKQAADFQKTAFTNWYNAVAMIQDQSASVMEAMMNQAGLTMPEEARKAIKSWVNAYQEGFKRFHSYIEIGFLSLEKPIVQEAKPAPAESAKLLTEAKKVAQVTSPKPVAKKKVEK